MTSSTSPSPARVKNEQSVDQVALSVHQLHTLWGGGEGGREGGRGGREGGREGGRGGREGGREGGRGGGREGGRGGCLVNLAL